MSTPHTYLPLTDFVVPPDRQRQEFLPAEILELANSIASDGLFHAVQVRRDGRTLVTGERRLRAIREHLVPMGRAFTYGGEPVPTGCVPIIKVGTDDPLALEEIELAENLRRKDLNWREMANTTARLHALRSAQVEVKRTAQANAGSAVVAGLLESIPAPIPAHTIADTAKEVRGSAIGWNQDATRQEVLIARHLHRPEIAAAPTLKDAFKVLKRLDETERNAQLARMVGDTYTTSAHKVFHANCLTWMAGAEWQDQFDVILTDPPYGMGAQDFGDAGGKLSTIEHHYDDSYEAWLLLMGGRKVEPDGSKRKTQVSWCQHAFHVTKPQAHAYVFCDIENFPELKFFMEEAGWYVFRTPLTNYKRNSGRVPLPDQGPRRQSEWCLYAIKGKKTVTGIYSDVIVTDSDEQLGHGAQKPVTLYEDLLKRSVRPGDKVLDTFAGTGPLLPAAHTFKCYAVVVEQNEASYGKCLERLQALGQQGELLP
jgi:DNA modification methylase/ParB-like chromosome segregation protein Spo0J